MEIYNIHNFDLFKEEDFLYIQKKLSKEINLKTNFKIENIKYIAGVDLSYWEKNNISYGGCSIAVIDYKIKKTLKVVNSFGKITVPYIPGFLAFREMPLFLNAVKKLSYDVDIFMFDGNGFLHERNMGIATHASFFIKKPTIGVAKSYYKIFDIKYTMPENKLFAYTDIKKNNIIYGRTLRSMENAKPIFISCGNYIDIETVYKITCSLLNNKSKLPIPTRVADLETHLLRSSLKEIFTLEN